MIHSTWRVQGLTQWQPQQSEFKLLITFSFLPDSEDRKQLNTENLGAVLRGGDFMTLLACCSQGPGQNTGNLTVSLTQEP